MSTIRYVGRKSSFRGNSLYWLIANLRDLGVGRVFIRSKEDFPEKCYYRLTKVDPDFSDPDLRSGTAWGERIFRGDNVGIVEIKTGGHRDWQLIPKEEEEVFCQIQEVHKHIAQRPPKLVDLPPLVAAMMQKEKNLSETPQILVEYPEEPLGLPGENRVKKKESDNIVKPAVKIPLSLKQKIKEKGE